MKGGGQEIKELPGGSPSVHISVGARQKRHGVREVDGEEECKSRLLLAAVPAACLIGCYFFPALPFLMNRFLF